ncbi:MAG: nuclear transport factor 2 family protein [Pseudobdellovibrionaceae bacterium]
MEIHTSPSAHAKFIDESTAEGHIRQLIENISIAIEERDLEQIMAAYTSDAVIYDARDALEIDKEGLRKSWEECFQVTKDFRSEIDEVTVIAEGNLGFSHCLAHTTGTTTSGENVDNWIRLTDCYRLIDGDWKVIHEHVSMPGDFVTGKILLDIKPSPTFS